MISRPELSTLARVRSSVTSLGPSERKVAAVILTQPDDVMEWSTAEVAQAAATSTATVIRACQSLGFRGFQHLRLELARSSSSRFRAHDAATGDPANDDSGADDTVARTFADAVEAVRLAEENVETAGLESAAAALRTARRVVLVGNGFSGPPLQDFAMRLSVVGRAAEAPVDALAQQFAAHSLREGDLCFALSYSGANVQTLRACTAAADQGATVSLVTSYARSPIARISDIVITTGPAGASHDVDPFLARLGHTVVLHALHSALALQAPASDVSGMRHVVFDALTEE
ncbi:MAG: MurR/RpiR family transcriptional regulator [Microbacterium sp.]|uniref:MurR/RpiR family transcriptional regulator n=1 Tax=Microbacterium sp. TaxID=51671 RepID=UPI000DB3858E|nr:MurR/RpiR family transcriptional regulator [Microbacterium sp.]PZU39680.1 MAG: MurR/RpiR family transcriptional regulator [Microbacterium sp.]